MTNVLLVHTGDKRARPIEDAFARALHAQQGPAKPLAIDFPDPLLPTVSTRLTKYLQMRFNQRLARKYGRRRRLPRLQIAFIEQAPGAALET